jgi:hypothetical protein
VVEPDPTMTRIGEGIGLGRSDRAAARRLFAEVWEEIGADGDALHRCALAHAMADVQDDLAEEIRWDLRALEAADLLSDERVRHAGIAGSARGFYPSLHLNLAEGYRKLGDVGRARDHLGRGYAVMDALADDGYAQMIRDGLDRIADRLSAEPPAVT